MSSPDAAPVPGTTFQRTTSTNGSATRSRLLPWALAALALVCALAFLWRLGGNGLFDLDEALYVECAREMRLSGDYVTPRVNGIAFFEKPPLVYWEAAGLFTLFGRNETAARLPSALATIAVVIGLYLLGSRMFGRRAGLLAAFSFALAPLVLGAARQLTTDATLDLCIFAALACFWRVHTAPKERASGWSYGFWIACAFGVLAKGLPGILIPCVVAAIYLLLVERWGVRAAARELLRLRPLSGALLFLLVAAPWHIAAW